MKKAALAIAILASLVIVLGVLPACKTTDGGLPIGQAFCHDDEDCSCPDLDHDGYFGKPDCGTQKDCNDHDPDNWAGCYFC